jgi:hypothetical protein
MNCAQACRWKQRYVCGNDAQETAMKVSRIFRGTLGAGVGLLPAIGAFGQSATKGNDKECQYTRFK